MYNIGSQARMRKFLGRPIVEPSHDPGAGVTSSPITAQAYRPSASQNAVYAAGSPIKCIDKSPDGNSALLAGPHILKTVKLDGLSIREGLDLRSLITVHPASKNASGSSTSDQLSIRDAKWAAGQSNRGNATIFTACTNGKIFQYDLSRAGSVAAGGMGLEFVQVREDTRQVNALDVNPHRGTLLLSGSQDGIARCFDIRVPVQTKGGLTFRSVHPFKCNADSVRQVKWSPKDGFYFACSTDQGVVLKWDIRKHLAPILKIKAHDKGCSSIAWHPDGEHLMSAGGDNRCHVWDLSKNADKRQKAKWTIVTPAPASVVVWRPGQWSATAQGKRAAQVAVSYDDGSQKRHGINSVHIWDLARPTMPYKEIQRFDSLPSAMLWHDQDLLWTAGQDGLFNQCDVAFAPKVIDRQTVSTMAFSAKGDVLMFLDERAQPHRPRLHVVHPDVLPTSSLSSSPNTPMLSVSRSDSEDEVVGNFLGPRRRGGVQRRRLSMRSAQALSSTPPSASGMDEHPLPLDQAINITGIFRSQQALAVGHVPAAANVDVYEYLSVNYLETLNRELPYSDGGRPMAERVASILEHYARAAEGVSQFRLAQTWRILAYGMDLLLRRRAQYHHEFRMRRLKKPSKKSEPRAEVDKPSIQVPVGPAEPEEPPRKVHSSSSLSKQGHHHVRSILSEEIESTSNVPTPLAQPVRENGSSTENHHGHPHAHPLNVEPIPEPESFALPPSLQEHTDGRQRLGSMPLSTASFDSESTQDSQAATEGYDFYDTEALTRAIDMPVPKRKEEPLVLDYVEPGSPSTGRAPALRHDSDASFSHAFSVSDDSGGTSGPAESPNGGPSKTSGASGGSAGEGEYASRIRGKQMEESPARSHPLQPRQPLERTETGLTSFTDEHHMITQTTSGSLTSRQDDFPTQTDTAFSLGSPETRPYWPEPADPFPENESLYMVETDYLHWPDDPPYPHPIDSDTTFSTNLSPPLNPYILLSRALEFEVRSSALNASAIILLLKPLVPEGVIDSFQAAAILRQHHSRLMSMRLFVEAALLRKLCLRGWPGGALHGWGEDYRAIFSPAQQGVQAGLFCPACRKPRESTSTSSTGSSSVWRCERCSAVMGPCAVCGHRDATPMPGGDCDGDGDDDDDDAGPPPALSTWWYCPGCGHGGHSTCLQAWHAPSSSSSSDGDQDHDNNSHFPPELAPDSGDGCCPLDGCGHACLGQTETTSAARAEDLSRAVREAVRAGGGGGLAKNLVGPGVVVGGGSGGSGGGGGSAGAEWRGGGGGSGSVPPADHVRGDAFEAVPSRAVDGAREMLAGGSAGREAGGGILSSSPGGRTGGERERRKSVKFAGPEQRR